MSAFSVARRAQVEVRAESHCEYCHIPAHGQVATFPIDHIVPKARGGSNEVENLALACTRCNDRKWCRTQAADPATGEETEFYNPRRQNWFEHFQWDSNSIGVLIGLTPTGRATVDALKMNAPATVSVRSLLFRFGLFPEIGA